MKNMKIPDCFLLRRLVPAALLCLCFSCAARAWIYDPNKPLIYEMRIAFETDNWINMYSTATVLSKSDNTVAFRVVAGSTVTPTYQLVVTTQGNVGIGTAEPTQKLEVAGNLRVTAPYVFLFGDTSYGYIVGGSSLSNAPNIHLSNPNRPGLEGGHLSLTAGYHPTLGTTTSQFINFYTGTGGDQERMRIARDGNVGIGTTGPGATFQVGSSGGGQTTLANSWGTFSSIRYKDGVREIPSALDKIGRLRGVEFRWKDSGKEDIGIVAEEVGKVFPDIVQYEQNGKDAKGVDYSRLVAPLIEAVKEQQHQIEELKQEVNGLKRGVKTK